MKFEILDVKDLVDKAKVLFFDKYRLAQICCTKSVNFEIIYSFAKDAELVNYKLVFPDNAIVIPSISPVYAIAFLYENEIKDLFGFKFSDLSLDYNGCFYQTKIKNPFLVSAEGTKNG